MFAHAPCNWRVADFYVTFLILKSSPPFCCCFPLPAAEHQAAVLAKLRREFDLTLREQQVLARGRNAASGTARNKRRSDPVAYQNATALEALLGYLYIADPPRCQELLRWLRDNLD